MHCGNCGKPVEEGTLFCGSCGHKIERPEKKCPACGVIVGDNDPFCGSCGCNLTSPPVRKDSDKDIRNDSVSGNTSKKGLSTSTIIVIAVSAVLAIALIVGGIWLYSNWDELFGNQDNNDARHEQIVSTSKNEKTSKGSTGSKSSSPAPKASTPSPSPSPLPTATPEPVHTYEVVVAHVSWDTARSEAARRGGHLVTFSSQAEFDTVTGILASYPDVKNVWIGACAPAGLNSSSAAASYWNSSSAAWITGEPFTFTKWRHGEPSGYDAQMNMDERYVQIFCPKADGGVWSYNDAGNDLSEYKPNSLAYVIEYEH